MWHRNWLQVGTVFCPYEISGTSTDTQVGNIILRNYL
jgi:hypothetical protein